jgi:glycerol-3-phosphate O-acyltransferase
METLNTKFRDLIVQGISRSKTSTVITEQNVYQEADLDILPLLDTMVERLSLPGSFFGGLEYAEDLLDKARSGKSCLLFVEHYSNLDLSIVSYFARRAGSLGAEFAKSLVAIAGMKLNEDNPAVAAFASAYTRLVIYPSRSLQGLDAEKDKAELIRSNGINRAAMRVLNGIKLKGRIILVFPSGTRYRPWDPSTRKGVREIDSYVRSFDYMSCVALNGEILHVRQGDMMDDSVSEDLLIVTAGPVQSCAAFREKARAAAEAAGVEDKKQATVDSIMEELERMHIEVEKKRRILLKKTAAL